MKENFSIFSSIIVDLINDTIDFNESLYNQIDYNSNKENDTVSHLFVLIWQIGVRWKTFITLAEAHQDTGVNIILRSIYELQRNLEFILESQADIREKILAYKLQVTIETLSLDLGPGSKDRDKLTLPIIIKKQGLDEISDLVLEKFSDKTKWWKFQWYYLFTNNVNFSSMTRDLSPNTTDFTDPLFKNLSMIVHGNSFSTSPEITREHPFREVLTRETLIYSFTILSDLDLVIGSFLNNFYPELYKKFIRNGTNQLLIKAYLEILIDMDSNQDNLASKLKKKLQELNEEILNL